jgi:pimeloyl-ACP methyl ester carboxylesterase
MSESNSESGYCEVTGLKMYSEIYGQGKPLVLIHGGGSTIQTSYGNIIPLLSKDRQIIAMELQAHGRTGDRPTDLSFEQDADDVAMLLNNLKRKQLLHSAFYRRSAEVPQFWTVSISQ